MQAKIEITMDNAAFADAGSAHELGRILAKLADDLRQPHATLDDKTLRDINGNRVGYFEVTTD